MSKHRLGHITASTVSRFLTGKAPDKLLAGTITACEEIALERLGWCPELPEFGFQGNYATEWGNTHEEAALAAYERKTGLPIHVRQKVFKSGKWLSCTPDGIIAGNRTVQVKCPHNPHNHFTYMLKPADFMKAYYDQIQFEMWLTGLPECDLVSYDPRYIEGRELLIVNVKACTEWQAFAKVRLPLVEAKIQEIIEQFNVN